MQVANQILSHYPGYMNSCYWWLDLLPGLEGEFIPAGVGCIVCFCRRGHQRNIANPKTGVSN